MGSIELSISIGYGRIGNIPHSDFFHQCLLALRHSPICMVICRFQNVFTYVFLFELPKH